MNRIDAKFKGLREQRRAALMPYLPLGYPTIDVSCDLVRTVADAGADIIELGIPFSDPLADGPVIQHATQVALQNGMTLLKCLRIALEARQAGVAVPLVLMGYYNPILQFGIEAFAHAAKEAGVDGLIVPDLPPEEAGPLDKACRVHDIDMIFLAAPTSTTARLKKIAEATRGFMYLVSVTGVTGARGQIAADLPDYIGRVRGVTNKPACAGFGISNAETAQRVAHIADGVIVGSALVSRLGGDDPVGSAKSFMSDLRDAIE
jgi:tryptophan synthase alpha chain